ncbi:hypothetical protein [Phyllobacterium sp. P5_D12]
MTWKPRKSPQKGKAYIGRRAAYESALRMKNAHGEVWLSEVEKGLLRDYAPDNYEEDHQHGQH